MSFTDEPTASTPVHRPEAPHPIGSDPVVSEDEDSDRPRRSGWWSKRVLGKR
jgi:hypothetical protein